MYIGYVITKEGLEADPQKMKAILDVKRPTEVTEVTELQRFMGMITYVAKFIPDLSNISAPLRILLAKETKWHWDSAQEQSWIEMKRP